MVLRSTWLLYTFYIKVFEIYLAATPFGFAPFFSLNIAGIGAEKGNLEIQKFSPDLVKCNWR